MPTAREITALNELQLAAEVLTKAFQVSGGAQNRCDQIKAFVASSLTALAHLTEAADDLTDPAYVQGEIQSVQQAVDVAFMDAVEAEEKAEPRFNARRHYGTYDARAL